MQNRIDELEQYTRKDNLVLSSVDCRTYAEVARFRNTRIGGNTEDESVEDRSSINVNESDTSSNLEQKEINFFDKEMKVKVKPEDISVTHFFQKKE